MDRSRAWDVTWDLTPRGHLSLHLSLAVTHCQAVQAQTPAIVEASRYLSPFTSLAVIATFGTVTAEVASSSLVVPAIFFKDLASLRYVLVVQRLHAGQSPHRVIYRYSDVRQHFGRFQIVLVRDSLRVPEGLRHRVAVTHLLVDLRTVETRERIPPMPVRD